MAVFDCVLISSVARLCVHAVVVHAAVRKVKVKLDLTNMGSIRFLKCFGFPPVSRELSARSMLLSISEHVFQIRRVDDFKEKRVLRTPTPLPKGGATSIYPFTFLKLKMLKN